MNPVSVGEALAHQDAAIIAAGHAGQGEEFIHLVDNIISQCEFQPRGLFRGGDSRSLIQPISRVERYVGPHGARRSV